MPRRQDSTQKKGLSKGAIAGITIGSIVAAAALIGIVTFAIKKNKNNASGSEEVRRRSPSRQESSSEEENPDVPDDIPATFYERFLF